MLASCLTSLDLVESALRLTNSVSSDLRSKRKPKHLCDFYRLESGRDHRPAHSRIKAKEVGHHLDRLRRCFRRRQHHQGFLPRRYSDQKYQL